MGAGHNEYISGCTVNIKLSLKSGLENNGGHEHLDSGRPLGVIKALGISSISEITNVFISLDGLEVTYESPEVAAVVALSFTALNPKKEPVRLGNSPIEFEVRVRENLQRILILGLNTIRNFSDEENVIQSHPDEGDYLTQESHAVLSSIVDDYFMRNDQIKNFDYIPVVLKTEGASLSWGGLFDINENWMPSHIAHRNGRNIDLSLSVFGTSENGLKAKRGLKDAILTDSLDYPREVSLPEPGARPGDEKKNHWHLQFDYDGQE